VGALASRAAQDGDAVISVEQRGKPVQIVARRRYHRRLLQHLGLEQRLGRCGLQSDVARNYNDRHATPADRFADRDLEDTRHLIGGRHELAIVTAFLEKRLRMCLLKKAGSDLGRRDMRRNGKHGDTGAAAIEQSVDEMQVPGAATSRADGDLAGQMRLGSRGERGNLLVTHMDPLDLALTPDGIGQAVQAVPDDPVDALDTRNSKRFNELVSDGVDFHRPRRLCLRSCPLKNVIHDCYPAFGFERHGLRMLVARTTTAAGVPPVG
jgi:hypothetical protein